MLRRLKIRKRETGMLRRLKIRKERNRNVKIIRNYIREKQEC